MPTIERAFVIRSIAVLFWAISFGASAQTNWPNGQTVRVIVPFPGGASTLDSVVRTVTPDISKTLGSPVIVDNKPGAGTVIGVDATAKATDNLTVGAVANSFTVNQSLIKSLPYNTTRDLQPVVLMARTANVLAVKSTLPVNNLKELVQYAKKNPGKLSYASFGNGTTAHFAGEMLKSMAGIYVVHIPYRGQGPALTDLIAGNVDFMFGNLPDFLPYIKSGKIKAIGTTYLTRAPLAPEIPTIAEQGFPTFETDSWYGIVAPSSMTKDAVDKMNQAVNKALQDPAVKKNLGDRGIEIIGGTPAKFQEHIQSEILKYERIVKSANMQAD
ncbi:tripartite tricarboxylate transporter substrate binding protein [Polynucleobacter sp. 15G-AUS-farblos]|uniref:Bug family tripartite tricarboxylate transporter substrate binding protein n=1 Tax=Polynucleobacter sp. 15G-AUS-farblos TaxID=2689094 RepID=UPI001C20C960|nr:tripartite tricarboxylate transporter substrate binding protein [Polynucleobacter sp. 15G-AUS-farblos]